MEAQAWDCKDSTLEILVLISEKLIDGDFQDHTFNLHRCCIFELTIDPCEVCRQNSVN